jgi:hypothetical protein
MPRGFAVPVAASSWSLRDVQTLRSLVDAGTSVREIARILRRTESAVRNRAAHHGISLRGLAGTVIILGSSIRA